MRRSPKNRAAIPIWFNNGRTDSFFRREDMNSLLISDAVLLARDHPLHGKKVMLHVERGKIKNLAKSLSMIDSKATRIDGKGQYLSPGFFDLNARFGEPGLETKEDVRTGCATAIAGGFTGVALQPNTVPPIDDQSGVALLINRAKEQPVDVYPVGTISKALEGESLAELYDMHLAGAVAFSDGDRSVQQAGLMSRALLYAKGFGGLVFSRPEDHTVAAGANMNEGVMSTYLGMKGNPNLAESLMVARDIFLAEYNDAPIHFSTISTAESVELIRKAKRRGQPVTCDVAAHHLILTDDAVAGFDSHYKVSPPLRTKADVKALLKGLKDGTIDAIVSQHTPHEVEFKNVEFQIAKNGMVALQTVLPLLIQAGLEVEQIVDKLAYQPRKILGLPIPTFEEGSDANFVMFDTKRKWTLDASTNRSKSANTPFWGKELTGSVTIATNKRILYTSDY